MVSLVINCRRQRWWTNSAAGCCGAPLQGRRRHPARGDSDEPDAARPVLKSSEEAPGVRGRSTRPEKARTEDGARGGPAEERAWTRGRCMQLLRIEEARTRSEQVTTVLNKSVDARDLNSLQTWLYS